MNFERPVLTCQRSGEPIHEVRHQWDQNFGYYDVVGKHHRLLPVLSEVAFRCLGCDAKNEANCERNRFFGLYQTPLTYFESRTIEPKLDDNGKAEPGRFLACTKDGCSVLDRGAIIDLNPEKPTIEPYDTRH